MILEKNSVIDNSHTHTHTYIYIEGWIRVIPSITLNNITPVTQYFLIRCEL